MRRIWFIDDKQDNRDAWVKGFGAEIRAHCELKSFDNWPDLRYEFENKTFPDVLFLDFFIGDHYGHEIIGWIDVHYPNDQRPVIVAHSSMEAPISVCVKKGANGRLEKWQNQ